MDGDIKVNLPTVNISTSLPMAAVSREAHARASDASIKRKSLNDLIAICTGMNRVTASSIDGLSIPCLKPSYNANEY
jgi:hypothetical protein